MNPIPHATGLAPEHYTSAVLEHGPTALIVLWIFAIAGPMIPRHLAALLRITGDHGRALLHATADLLDPPAKPPAAVA